MFSIIMMILSFFLSKKAGLSNGQAAMVAGAAGLATWTTIDPANPDAIWKPFHDKEETSTSISDAGTIKPPSMSPGEVISNLGGNISDVAQSWGPAGTTGAIVGIGTSGKIIEALKKIPPIVWIGASGLLLYKFVSK